MVLEAKRSKLLPHGRKLQEEEDLIGKIIIADSTVLSLERLRLVMNNRFRIDDYLRKKVEYGDKGEAAEGQKRRKLTEDCEYINLPMIDIQLYKREDANLRNYREQ